MTAKMSAFCRYQLRKESTGGWSVLDTASDKPVDIGDCEESSMRYEDAEQLLRVLVRSAPSS